MEVRLGTDVGFLQDAVLVKGAGVRDPEARDLIIEAQQADVDHEGAADGDIDPVDGGSEADDKGRGKVYAFGQIKGKMVVVPDWGRLYD